MYAENSPVKQRPILRQSPRHVLFSKLLDEYTGEVLDNDEEDDVEVGLTKDVKTRFSRRY